MRPVSKTSDPLDFTGRTVVVTGGTRGLGRVIVRTFLDAGADVVTCARSTPDEPVESTDGSRTAAFVEADVRDPDLVAGVVAAAVDRTGRVDVLVNNAGGAPPADSATVSPRFNEKILALNLTAPMTASQAVYPVMSAQDGGGVILNISSVSGGRPNPLGVAYGAAKAGLLGLVRGITADYGAAGIRANALIPGGTDTAMAGDAESKAWAASLHAMKRIADPDEIAQAALFLASDMASFVSGSALWAEGGNAAVKL